MFYKKFISVFFLKGVKNTMKKMKIFTILALSFVMLLGGCMQGSNPNNSYAPSFPSSNSRTPVVDDSNSNSSISEDVSSLLPNVNNSSSSMDSIIDSIISSSSNLENSSSSTSSAQESFNSSSEEISSNSSNSSSESTKPVEPVEPETDNVYPYGRSTINTGITDIGDPYILADKNTNKYYIYGTLNGGTRGFWVWESSDLYNWTNKSWAYKEVNSGSNITPFENCYWAPEVVYNPSTRKYIMFFSASLRNSGGIKKLGVATADSPLGPFTHTDGLGVMFEETLMNTEYIDAHFFLDDDNQAYLLYCNDCSKNNVNGINTSQTWIRKLDSTWTRVVGAGKMISTPTQDWETQEDSGAPNTQWNEAPALFKHAGKYYLMYSANPFWNPLYGVGCAVSDNIWGEYVKYDWNPILVKIEGQTTGPGHNMLFKDLNDNLWASYHIHTYYGGGADPGNRTAMLSPAWFDKGILKIEYGQLYEEELVHKDNSVKPVKKDVDFSKETNLYVTISDLTGIGDPFVLADPNSQKYYAYATSDVGVGYKVWESCDLVNWKYQGTCFNKNTASSFGVQDFWSPEVVYNPTTRKYLMYYTGKNSLGISKTGVAISDSPIGPFISVVNNQPMFDLGSEVATVDASLFVDDDGQAYLYYVKDCSKNVVDGKATSQIFGVKVDTTWTQTIGEHYLISTPDVDWEIQSATTDGNYKNEAPFMYKYNGTYYLTYSANLFTTTYYGVGVATSNDPLSGFTKNTNNPIMKTIEGEVSGPGHVMMFVGFDGNLRAAYHTQVDQNNFSGNRRLEICGAWFNNGELVIEYTKTI